MKKYLMTYAAGRLVLAIFFCCAMTTVVNAQNTVDDLLKAAEQKAFDGDPLIICDENLQFKVIPKEEKDKYPMDFSFFYQFANPRYLEFRDCSAGMIFFSPADFDRVLKKYREFKAANK